MFKRFINSTFNPRCINHQIRSINANSTVVTKIHRKIYARTYPTIMVLADGSSINIRYHEPRKIIQLPLDLSTLTEEQRKERLESRKPKKQIKVEEHVEDNFDAQKYLRQMQQRQKTRK